MLIAQKDVDELLQFAVLLSAQKSGIEAIDFDNSSDILKSIQENNPSLSVILNNFINAYKNWFNGIEDPEHSEIYALMSERDDTRNKLIAALRNKA